LIPPVHVQRAVLSWSQNITNHLTYLPTYVTVTVTPVYFPRNRDSAAPRTKRWTLQFIKTNAQLPVLQTSQPSAARRHHPHDWYTHRKIQTTVANMVLQCNTTLMDSSEQASEFRLLSLLMGTTRTDGFIQ
jgi:hypothetical protein